MFLTVSEKQNNIGTVQLDSLKHYKVNAVVPLWSFHLGVLQKAIGLQVHGIIDIPHLSAVIPVTLEIQFECVVQQGL